MALTRRGFCFALACLALVAPASLLDAKEVKPKLGPDAISVAQSHAYLQSHPAPDFWSLSPFYVPQVTESACSLAALTMLVNALRGLLAHDDQPLVTQDSLLRAVGSERWAREAAENGSGVTFEEFKHYVRVSLEVFHLEADIEVTKPDSNSVTTLTQLRNILIQNEQSDRDIVLVYFNQGVLTGSWDGPHISPIAAYDADRHLVLIMDVDRQWYIPYWASDEKLLEAMLRPAPANRGVLAGETGGLIRASLKSASPH